MSLNGRLNLNSNYSNQKIGDLSTAVDNINQSASKSVTTGSLYHSQLDLTGGVTLSIDLNDGSLNDVFGDAVTLSGVTSMYFKAGSTNGSDVVISTGANSILNTQPGMGANEAIGYLMDIDITTDSKLYFDSTLSGYVDVIVAGD